MSKTPRTDAARLDEHDPAMAIASECAKMELELSEKDIQINSLKHQLDHAKRDLSNWVNLVEKAEQERDEAVALSLQTTARLLVGKFERGETDGALEAALARVKQLEEAGGLALGHAAKGDFASADIVWTKAKEAKP